MTKTGNKGNIFVTETGERIYIDQSNYKSGSDVFIYTGDDGFKRATGGKVRVGEKVIVANIEDRDKGIIIPRRCSYEEDFWERRVGTVATYYIGDRGTWERNDSCFGLLNSKSDYYTDCFSTNIGAGGLIKLNIGEHSTPHSFSTFSPHSFVSVYLLGVYDPDDDSAPLFPFGSYTNFWDFDAKQLASFINIHVDSFVYDPVAGSLASHEPNPISIWRDTGKYQYDETIKDLICPASPPIFPGWACTPARDATHEIYYMAFEYPSSVWIYCWSPTTVESPGRIVGCTLENDMIYPSLTTYSTVEGNDPWRIKDVSVQGFNFLHNYTQIGTIYYNHEHYNDYNPGPEMSDNEGFLRSHWSPLYPIDPTYRYYWPPWSPNQYDAGWYVLSSCGFLEGHFTTDIAEGKKVTFAIPPLYAGYPPTSKVSFATITISSENILPGTPYLMYSWNRMATEWDAVPATLTAGWATDLMTASLYNAFVSFAYPNIIRIVMLQSHFKWEDTEPYPTVYELNGNLKLCDITLT